MPAAGQPETLGCKLPREREKWIAIRANSATVYFWSAPRGAELPEKALPRHPREPRSIGGEAAPASFGLKPRNKEGTISAAEPLPRILIAEDERDLAEMISFHLKKRGFEPGLAANGLEAWEELKSGRWDLLVLDLMMPGLDGWELCRLIRRSEDRILSGIPILMLSARATPEDRVQELELGADDYLTKPFSLAELGARADRLLQKKRSLEGLQREIEGLRLQITDQESNLREIIHDLKNPLLSIGASAKVLMNRNSDEGKISFLRGIYENSLSMTRWLEELLALSDFSLKSVEKDKEWVDPGSLAKNAADLLRPIGLGKKIEVEFQNPDLLPGLWANKRWVQRAVENLIANALKYTPEEGKVEIKTRLSRKGGEMGVEISVRDNGIGIPGEDIAKVFDPFYRARNARNEKGIGLGLSLVKQVVDFHGGKIEVKSEVGIGSCFSIFLPIGGNGPGNRGEREAS